MKIAYTLVLGAGMMLGLSACDKKATGQVVATVNGEEVSQQELNAEIQALNPPATADKKEVTNAILQRVIDRKVLIQKAREQGLDTSPEYLQQSRRLQEGLLVDMLVRKSTRSLPLPSATDVNKFITDRPTIFAGRKRFALDQVVFDPVKDPALIKQLDAVKSLADVSAVLTAQKLPFDRGKGLLDTATIAPDLANKINALPPGQPFILPAGGKLVASVIASSETTPLSETQSKQAATDLLRKENVETAMQKQLAVARKAAKVDYQPGFAPPKAAATKAAAAK